MKFSVGLLIALFLFNACVDATRNSARGSIGPVSYPEDEETIVVGPEDVVGQSQKKEQNGYSSNVLGHKKSCRRYKDLAKEGIVRFQFEVGMCYAQGGEFSKNLPKAYQWFLLAEEKGHVEAKVKRVEIEAQLKSRDVRRARDFVRKFRPSPGVYK